MAPKRKPMTFADVGAAQPRLCLEYSADAQRKSVVLHGGGAYIGRNKDLRLAFSEQLISQVHAQIELDVKKKQWKIKDMNSSHGTDVNGKAVNSKRATFLKDGDTLTLSGEIEIVIKVMPPASDPATSNVESMLRQYGIFQGNVAQFEAERQAVDRVDEWETQKGSDDEEESEDEEDE